MPRIKVTAARGRVVDDVEVEPVADITEHPIRVGFRPEMSIPCSPDVPIESLIPCEYFDPLCTEEEDGKTLGLKCSKLNKS